MHRCTGREARTIFSAVAMEFAWSHDIADLDLSEAVQGHEESLMADFLHLNDRGAEVVGRLIVQQMLVRKRAFDISHSPMVRRMSVTIGAFH